MTLILMYLGAVVLANLGAAWLGPAVTPLLAFLFIGLDLVARDGLHERWGRGGQGGLWWRMFVLIAVGSLLSWALNRGAGRAPEWRDGAALKGKASAWQYAGRGVRIAESGQQEGGGSWR